MDKKSISELLREAADRIDRGSPGQDANQPSQMRLPVQENSSPPVVAAPSLNVTRQGTLLKMAGRMIGHSFLHGGPCLSGISPAIVHVLFGGTPETVTIQLEDCPDLDLRSTIQLLEGNTELSEQEKGIILDLALSWDLLGVNQNRRWLFERLLLHAVINDPF
ncbi:hypothetical protein EOD39_14125 [Acipenser ruthenus]|uniref:Uncharacterized protein n=1 Tax=Acipenser ruthenus TaxID=7906 RepID=A0A662YMM5_ACIRT|nr:hypothetical protein EOD39_14125 [Acipenser ruthenus]